MIPFRLYGFPRRLKQPQAACSSIGGVTADKAKTAPELRNQRHCTQKVLQPPDIDQFCRAASFQYPWLFRIEPTSFSAGAGTRYTCFSRDRYTCFSHGRAIRPYQSPPQESRRTIPASPGGGGSNPKGIQFMKKGCTASENGKSTGED
ncbi:hypothetical protein [Pelobacter propionicus]|uniref:Uncharacterized protein n=1 Tax=Pelobacter propionicus (strain DSM 2379 / NBRC 103807 / OttBd1) TaxID=338966 RepID=A1AMT8_PELPD|nr:hypothetical protein [Pelobacter propionicus]ABK98658.1 hypothetical protein Ppro_1032 [Pelobacter propionicus DSM 2379]